MVRRQSNNIEATGTLNEFRDEDGELDGIQLYMVDEREFGDLLLDWLVKSGYSIDKTSVFLKQSGLEGHITESQWLALICGSAPPGRVLAGKLIEPICEMLQITPAKVLNRVGRAQARMAGRKPIEIGEGVAIIRPPRTEGAQPAQNGDVKERPMFGRLLEGYIKRADLSHAMLNEKLRALDPEAGGSVSRWLDGTRAPRPVNMRLFRDCLNLTPVEHDELVRSCWGDHIKQWHDVLEAVRLKPSFGTLFRAYYRSRISPKTCHPYNYLSISEALDVSPNKIINLETEVTLPNPVLFEKICLTLDLPEQDVDLLAEAVAQGNRDKHNAGNEIERLTDLVFAEEGVEHYTDLIKLYRQQTGMSVADAVETLGVKRDLVAYLEQGKRIVRPETRQQAKEYLGKLGMPPHVQNRMIYAMDYTNLGITQKLEELETLTGQKPYNFPRIFKLYRETAFKPDGGIGIPSALEAAGLFAQRGSDVHDGTIRNWETSIGERKPEAEGKVVQADKLKPYMEMIDIPEQLQVALLRRLADHQRHRSANVRNKAKSPQQVVTHSEPEGRVIPEASKDQAR